MINIIVWFGIVFGMLLLIDKFDKGSKLKFLCTIIGWHKAPLTQLFDGVSRGGKCPRCGKKVLQDGNGDWF